MKSAITGICLFLMIGFVSPTIAGFQIWDFEDAERNKEWKVANGKWKFNKGVYQETSGIEAAMHSIVGETKWDDYTVEAKVRMDEGNWAGLLFRAQNEFEYYVFYLNQPDQKTELWVHKKGAFDAREVGNPQNYPVKGKIKIKNGDWNHMKIEVKGEKFKLFLDDIEQGEGQAGISYKNGSIGVWCWETKASFDDVKITGKGVKTLPVNPKFKLASVWGQLKRE